tara:strand:+ start:283 stop:615 length:333 start_codon:yes stop_codon:yes gene_type:complete
MAQDFESTGIVVTNSETTLLSAANSDDAIIGLRLANVLTTTVTVDVYIDLNGAGTDFYIIKGASIPPAGSIELIQGGSKIVLNSGDIVNAVCNTSNGVHAWISIVDAIST